MATVRVTGIGGIFVRAHDPDALRAWYERHFGIAPAGAPWMQEAGPTVFATFTRDDPYLGGPEQGFMLNLRVADLDAAIRDLAAAGIPAETRAEWAGPHGSFARVHDPEGNPIELWQPPPMP
ncbi:MAG: VOC family protein [Salinarimonas sp.]